MNPLRGRDFTVPSLFIGVFALKGKAYPGVADLWYSLPESGPLGALTVRPHD